ncbi:MAG: protein translocase subunit SecD [Alphaproteobacteria bacterium]
MKYVSPIRATIISLVCLLGFLFAAPNLLSTKQIENLPNFMPTQKIHKGLDLQGGSYLLLQVELKTLSNDLLKSARVDLRSKLREQNILHRSTIAGNILQITLNNPADANAALKVINDELPNWDAEANGNIINVSVAQSEVAKRASEAVGQSIEVIRRRVDPQGVLEPIIQRQGDDRIILQVPGMEDPDRLKELLGRTARLEFYMAHPTQAFSSQQISPQAGYLVFPAEDANNDGTPDGYYQVEDRLMMSGLNLKSASPVLDSNSISGSYAISFVLDIQGGTAFSNATVSSNKGRLIVIVLDGQVISAPAVNAHITGGSGMITGTFTSEEASDLSNLLNAGALPVPLKIIEEQSIGPSLGQDAIDAGVMASYIGLALVVGFMLVVYLRFGLFANIALFFNIILIVAMLSLLQATLTLPGIAGIVLTIGMAVDANVIIFERIREELTRQNIRPFQAVEVGYSNAMSTILDANVTTLIASAILYQFGTGPVKGFAVTLALGVLASLFTAIFVTRTFINIWLSIKDPRKMQVGIKLLNNVPHFPFMAIRKIAPAISLILVLASFAVLPTKGLNLGLDFTGGSQLIITAPESMSVDTIRGQVSQTSISSIGVTSYGHEGQYLISIPAQSGEDGVQNAAVNEVKASLSKDIKIEGTSTIGGSVSQELKRAGFMAVSLSILAMLVYISIRFEWQFGVAAVIALTHDVILTLGLFSLLGLDFNLTTVAAILTIAGYSINDTVVVFDRIRENMRHYKTKPMLELLELTLNQTLSRTIMTSFTTLLALIALYIFGTEVLQNFSFAMIWGIVVGTWSSLFVAVPLLLVLKVSQKAEEDKEKVSPYGNI